MIIKQLSVFLENKPGRLHSAATSLAEHHVNIRALSLADTAEFGILRLIVDKPEEGKNVLNNAGIVVTITDVLAVAMDDTPGGMLGALSVLSGEKINVEYMYACVGKTTGRALMILQTSDTKRAGEALLKSGHAEPDPRDLF